MDIAIVASPYDTARRGWRSGAGPEHLLQAGLAAQLQRLGHHVATIQVIEDQPAESPAEIRTAFELMRRVAAAVRAARAAGHFPLVLSGNCNAGAVGLLSGLTPARRATFWFDAHGESNTPDTTRSGFLDGMGLAIALGWCWGAVTASVPGFQPIEAETTFLLGARDVDPLEATLLAASKVTCIAVPDIPTTLPAALATAGLEDALGYLHLDLDVLDPALVGRANSLPVPGGLSLSQLRAAIKAIRARVPLGGVTIASYAPEYDQDHRVCEAAFAAIEESLTSVA
jgi:arginase